MAHAHYQSHAGFDSLLESRASGAAEEQVHEIWTGPLRRSKGVFSTFVYSHDPRDPGAAPQPKILHYSFDAVCRWGGVLGVLTKAGVLRISRSILVVVVFTLGLAAGTMVLASWVNDEHGMDTDAMDTMQQRVNIMVTFILGFFVQLNILRWWQHRESLRQLHGAVLDIQLFLTSLGAPQEQLQTITRLGLLSQALLFEEVRGAFLGEGAAADAGNAAGAAYEGLKRMGLLRAEEASFLVGQEQKAQAIWVWLASYAVGAMCSGALGDATKIAKIQKRVLLWTGSDLSN
eukprot:TRINITY_DN27535_c0_g1_i1.p1 TRINITY_DN27535_c0_g1~~TRINITY_DN27535_c0_g1_i1.p1  ORF type:complete len:299 (-),score=56.92 TRINITY_DN27535_c0_g1_i1:227-1093(-)